MSHEYWMGYFGFMNYDMERNQNPFNNEEDVFGEKCNDWDLGWYESQFDQDDL